MVNPIKDEMGKRYGGWLVIARAGSKRGFAMWLCQCDCGNQVEVSGNSLRSGKTTSCGCSRVIDELGNRHGKLTVIERVENLQRGDALWRCRCDCGNELVVVRGADLRANKCAGCAECRRYRPLPYGEAAKRGLLQMYRIRARRKGCVWGLTDEEFYVLTQQPCHYCGVLPSTVYSREALNGDYVYTGLDRVDNSKGYSRENILPCCTRCNMAKRAMTYDEFLAWVKRVYEIRDYKRDEEDIVSKLVELAKEMGIDDVGFLEWLVLHEPEVKDKYPARDVFVTLLGRSQRAYQAWELDPDFPVKKPAREPIPPTGAMGRVYTPKQVVQIAWWWWNTCAIEKRGRMGKKGGG